MQYECIFCSVLFCLNHFIFSDIKEILHVYLQTSSIKKHHQPIFKSVCRLSVRSFTRPFLIGGFKTSLPPQDSSQIELLKELMDLQKDMVVMLLSMLEGESSRSFVSQQQ